ncbi:MAG: hypothetical protein DRQ49_19685 [Gammaproteobacteria bacterium]|nr:MAG: hypothetical protein DRQ49_19685 [Gammaproteobacteria bacterium]RKZ42326.1 MAG: hypothetical protein DRQ41_07110 [Gammaproteobacteria bacterium]
MQTVHNFCKNMKGAIIKNGIKTMVNEKHDIVGHFLLGILFVLVLVSCHSSNITEKSKIEFADIPGNMDNIESFEMSKTEVTNQQYVEFLNAALRENKITVGKVVPLELDQLKFYGHKSKNQQVVYDEKGERMFDLLGLRVTGDHDQDGIFELWEMENPLNRIMLEYDSDNKIFRVAAPEKIDWNIYFNQDYLADSVKPVDSISNWAELHEFWPEGISLEGRKVVTFDKGDYNKDVLFVGHLDLDFELPSLEEVKRWPVNHIEYYGAKAFADFYGYDLPTFEELQWAAEGGKKYQYGTHDGTIGTNNTVYSGHSYDEYPKRGKRKPDFSNFPGKHKGHVQPVASFAPNPYGVYDLSGNVYEWSKSKNNNQFNCVNRTDKGYGSFIRIGGSWNYYDQAQSLATAECKDTGVIRGNDHFGFRVVRRKSK